MGVLRSLFGLIFNWFILPVTGLVVTATVIIYFTVGFPAAVGAIEAGVGEEIEYEEPTVTVGVDKGKQTKHNPDKQIQAAIEYWNENDERYANAYEATFVYKPDATNPDILIEYSDGAACEGSQPACATVASTVAQLRGNIHQANIKVAESKIDNSHALRGTLIHEMGHTRGVKHCEEPRAIMGCPGTADGEEAAFTSREHPWLVSEVTVYIDSADDTRTVFNTLRESYPEHTFTKADSEWDAHFVIKTNDCNSCGLDYSYGWSGGRPYGDDNDIEYLYYSQIIVTGETEEQRRHGLESALDSFLQSDSSNG